jgi:hypothetical protein
MKTGFMQHQRRNCDLDVVYKKEFTAICDGMSRTILIPS